MVSTVTQPSGWYDDPQDPSQLRYWDGVVWSSNVTPRVSPTVAQATIGMPYEVTPAAARPARSGAYGAQGPPSAPGGFVSPQQGQRQQDQGQQDQGQQGGQWPAYGQDPGYLAPQQSGWQSQAVPCTPDGVALSGWWKRVLARLIDGIIVSTLALPLMFSPLSRAGALLGDAFRKGYAAAEAGTPEPELSAQWTEQLDSAIMQVGLTVLAIYVIYEVAFLTMTGATPGKRAVGISVRLRDKPGPPPLLAVLMRTGVKEGTTLVGLVLGLFLSLFSLLNVLWPLWDDKKQAIHDRAGATNVVVGPQPRRDA
jgi:uncharacterized RDD family membrane protein YckC